MLRTRHARPAALTAAALALGGVGLLGPASPASADTGCAAVPAVFSTSSGLRTLGATGTLAPAVPAASYVDLAFDNSGSTLYGVPSGALAKLDIVNRDTGSVSSALTLPAGSGDTNPASGKTITAATGLTSGRLLLGSTTALYEVFADGRSVPSDYKLPSGTTLTGDLAQLPGGDVVAALADGKIGRLKADGSSVVVGTVADAAGLAVSGGSLLVATSSGSILRVASVPTTAGTAALDTASVTTGGPAYTGGASVQSAGECNVPTARAATATAPAGAPATLDLAALTTSGGTATTLALSLLDSAGADQTSLSLPAGDVSLDGTVVTLTPADGFAGSVSIDYRAVNSAGQSVTATITFRITAAATTSAAPTSSGSSNSASSSGSRGASDTSQVTPTAVPAGFERQDGGPDAALVLAGVAALVVAAAGGNLLRTRRRH